MFTKITLGLISVLAVSTWMIAIAPAFKIEYINPIIILAVSIAVRKKLKSLIPWIILIGVLLDIYSPLLFGTHILSSITAIIVADWIRGLHRHNNIIQLISTTIGVVVTYHGILLISQLITNTINTAQLSLTIDASFFTTRIFEAVITVAVVALVQRTSNRKQNDEFKIR